ncbi:DUF916 domain-containing protein [Lacticaseibacillus sp. GG6-2]
MFKRIVAIALFLGLGVGAGHTVHAASPNFGVAAVLPSNQLDHSLHYYDLVVAPGSQQTITLALQNTDTGTQRFKISTNRATTSATGTIDYGQHAPAKPQALAVDIESLLPKAKTYSLAPHTTKQIHLKLKAPAQAWQGVLLGGIRVEKLNGTSANANGAALTVHAAETIPIQLRATNALPKLTPKLTFSGVALTSTGNGTQVGVKLTNPVPAIQSGLSVHATVYHANATKAVLKKDANDLKLAPSSVMTMPLTNDPTQLAAGKYRVEVAADQAGRQWHFFKTFTIKSAVSKDTTTKVKNATKKPLPLWVGGALIAAVAVLGWVAWHLKSRQE